MPLHVILYFLANPLMVSIKILQSTILFQLLLKILFLCLIHEHTQFSLLWIQAGNEIPHKLLFSSHFFFIIISFVFFLYYILLIYTHFTRNFLVFRFPSHNNYMLLQQLFPLLSLFFACGGNENNFLQTITISRKCWQQHDDIDNEHLVNLRLSQFYTILYKNCLFSTTFNSLKFSFFFNFSV